MRIQSLRYLDQNTILGQSPIHGFGLFAKRLIPAGEIWWRASSNNVTLINRVQYETLMHSHLNPTMESLLRIANIYGYYSRKFDSIVVCLDNARYVNHSADPNSGTPPDGNPLCSMALRDIQPGEEILEDYEAYDHCPWSDLTCSTFAEAEEGTRSDNGMVLC